jgi:predicted trehalose synthase
MTENPDTVANVRAWVDRLRSSLPQSVDVAALGVKSKAPFQLLCTREALIWRTEELARNACDAL